MALSDTGGEWVIVENPLGGAPLIERRTNADGTSEARPIGLASGEEFTSEADRIAYGLAVNMLDGQTLDEAKQDFAAFDTIDAGGDAYLEGVNAERASNAAAAITILQTGRLQTTTPAGSGGAQPPASTTVYDPPKSLPVVNAATTAQMAAWRQSFDAVMAGPDADQKRLYQWLDENGWGGKDIQILSDGSIAYGASYGAGVAGHVIAGAGANAALAKMAVDAASPMPYVPTPSVSVAATNTGNTGTHAPQTAIPSGSTSVTGGVVTAADLGVPTNVSSSSSSSSSSSATKAIVAVIAIVIALLLIGGAS